MPERIILRNKNYRTIKTQRVTDKVNVEKIIEHFSPFSMIFEEGDNLVIHLIGDES